MQILQPPYESIFGEIKILLEELSRIDSLEDLLDKEQQLTALYQKFSYVKLSKGINHAPTQSSSQEDIDYQLTKQKSDSIYGVKVQDENNVVDTTTVENDVQNILDDVAEVAEDNSLEKKDARHASTTAPDPEEITGSTAKIGSEVDENLFQNISSKLEPMQDSRFSFAMEKEETKEENDYETRLAEKEAKLKELEQKRRKIVELSKEKTSGKEKTQKVYEDQNPEEHHDRKVKLASIKGLKITKSLFDEDQLEDSDPQQPKSDAGSILKSNVPTEYMEAPKPKPEFKLDLNDRIAFSQYLFGGSQSELNQVVATLNSFTSLEKAQEFLSDIYYEKDWKKVDSYAQRLWSLVESRFL